MSDLNTTEMAHELITIINDKLKNQQGGTMLLKNQEDTNNLVINNGGSKKKAAAKKSGSKKSGSKKSGSKKSGSKKSGSKKSGSKRKLSRGNKEAFEQFRALLTKLNELLKKEGKEVIRKNVMKLASELRNEVKKTNPELASKYKELTERAIKLFTTNKTQWLNKVDKL